MTPITQNYILENTTADNADNADLKKATLASLTAA